jgi:hypothetical protein
MDGMHMCQAVKIAFVLEQLSTFKPETRSGLGLGHLSRMISVTGLPGTLPSPFLQLSLPSVEGSWGRQPSLQGCKADPCHSTETSAVDSFVLDIQGM